MADVAVQVVCGCAQPGWNSAYRRIEGQLKALRGPRKEVEALKNRLLSIEEMISNAEELHLQAILQFLEDPTRKEDNLKRVNHWVPKCRGVYYDVNDVLDKWNTACLMLEIQLMVHLSRKVCFRPFSYFKRFRLHQEIVLHMKFLKKELQKFEENRIELDQHLNGQLIESLKQATSSYGLPKVYGRDEEKEILMSKLNPIRSSNQGGSFVNKIVAIVGTGGVGKTSLAQLVFSDDDVKKTFVPIWVSVPYKFELDKILRTILEQVNPAGPHNADALHTLLDSAVESIKDKKLLLVLDDLWTVEPREWNQLMATLEKSDSSSRILVTTQNYSVVQTMGAHNDSVIHLDLLSKDDSWSIVSSLASDADWNINGQSDQDLKDKFWYKCNGLPLVAHALKNQLLRSKNSKQDWNRILAIFPRDYPIEIDDVVELWMSQDYFTERPQEKGLRCFEILANRCLFQDSTKDYNGDIIKCKMTGLVYEFSQFLREHGGDRHFTLPLEASQDQIPNSMKKKKKLRTLFVVRSETSSTPSNPLSCDLLVKLKCLWTLNLRNCNIEKLPEKLDNLVHLRYLNLSGNPLTTLPKALCYLFNLQTLRLKGCTRLQRLPKEMGNLALKFRHLHIEDCDGLESLPKEIGRLTNLKTLDMFIIPSPDDPQNYEALKLEDLNMLEHIQGSIDIRRCRNLENANHLIQTENFVLNGRRNYHVNLKLNFEGSSNSTRIRDESAILDALQPHLDLMSLEIRGCLDPFYPDWINLLNCLKRLVFCGCPNWESLPPLGKLQSLESLQIEDTNRVVNVGLQFLGITSNDRGAISFPKLKELRFSRLASWRIWEWTTSSEEENGSTIMPCLDSLQISCCGNLEALPGFLRGIKKLLNLTIDRCTTLNQRCQENVGGDWDKISHIKNIKIDGVPIIPRTVVESQTSFSGNSTILTPGSTTGPSTSINLSNTYSSGAEVQGSTSGSSAIPTDPSSNTGPSQL